ncbi:Crp/Fnr family transcriptional regulator [Phenylobacterium sp.]|uniref:Crp/Fnr family transcriptional regulator n=1 Tax=Phenylobacterium sp. TaxID=1871053 RepID=UPI002E35CC17|nr:Crp/Fnr family transcriptional regulator [Phenylobacterium sp.]HEX2558791.1 Crp/Fnr family transcriptional regulator [Phenylobacterium sp.]
MTILDLFFARLRAAGPIDTNDLQLLLQLPRTTFTAPAQTAIARTGDRLGGATLLLQGMACRSRVRSAGARQILSIHIPGDALDLTPAFEARDDTLEALTTCRGVLIPYPALEAAMQRPSLRAAFARLAGAEANMLAERLVSLGRRAALERMAHFFCEIVARMDAVGLGANGRYDMPLTQADLADALGLSVVHVNRTLQQLRATGAISFRSQRLSVHDHDALRAMAEFHPSYLHLEGRQPAQQRAAQVA